MSAQLSLAVLPKASPRDIARAARETRLRRIVRMVAKAQGEHDFWFDHIVTIEVARKLDTTTAAAAMLLAELRRRGVLLSHDSDAAEVFEMPGGGRVTAWRVDESPRPRPFKRPRAGMLPRRLA